MGRFTRRLEPACIDTDVRFLPGGIFAKTQPRAASRNPPRHGVTSEVSRRLPGDPPPADAIARMLRVDHAGEYGATRIYEGQLEVLGHGRAGVIRQMVEAEGRHLARFETLLRERRVRPTLLHPLWTVAGYTLGAATALLGERAAMACTVAVEEVSDEHYRRQAEQLGNADPALRETLLSFRDDEIAHRDLAIREGAQESAGYDLISAVVKTGSRLAIWLSTRL
ncbi:MAG: demethoxyubiquinone hydroxylase family protein [Alphaproteobacteria bacterium]|nr:demethoxyubiquinone hydroxylase family protein [Alphaproteobacteria bacterium]